MKKPLRLTALLASLVLAAAAHAQVPPRGNPDQESMLAASDARVAANKRLVYDFWREVFEGGHLDLADKYLAEGYIQHNPNVPTGRAAFVEFFSKIRKPEPLQAGWKNKPTLMFAADKYVFLIVKRQEKDPNDPTKTYPAYWFDMVRVENGLIQEHWDAATKNPPAPR